LIFHKNIPAIPARLLRYYDSPEFRRSGVGAQRGLVSHQSTIDG
jgi:hypothetical protein